MSTPTLERNAYTPRLAELEKNRVYEFERGDYLKVAIIKKKGWMNFVGSRDSSVNVLYGGTVRYEDF